MAVALIALPSATVFVLNATLLVWNVMVPDARVAITTPLLSTVAEKTAPGRRVGDRTLVPKVVARALNFTLSNKLTQLAPPPTASRNWICMVAASAGTAKLLL